MKAVANDRGAAHAEQKRRQSLDGNQPGKQRKTYAEQTITNMVILI